MLPGVKMRLPSATAAAASVWQTASWWVRQVCIGVPHDTVQTASAYCVQKSVTVIGVLDPPPLQPAKRVMVTVRVSPPAAKNFAAFIASPPFEKRGAV